MANYDKKAWQRLPDEWDNNFSKIGWVPYRTNILDVLMDLNPPNILDVGCNKGQYIEALRDRGYQGHYRGIDITPNFIDAAKYSQKNEFFQVGDAQNIEYGGSQFDFTLLAGVLMHLPSINPALSEACRVAKNYVLASMYGAEGKSYSKHGGSFLNHYISQHDFMLAIPKGWKVLNHWKFKRDDRDHDNLIYQYLLVSED